MICVQSVPVDHGNKKLTRFYMKTSGLDVVAGETGLPGYRKANVLPT